MAGPETNFLVKTTKLGCKTGSYFHHLSEWAGTAPPKAPAVADARQKNSLLHVATPPLGEVSKPHVENELPQMAQTVSCPCLAEAAPCRFSSHRVRNAAPVRPATLPLAVRKLASNLYTLDCIEPSARKRTLPVMCVAIPNRSKGGRAHVSEKPGEPVKRGDTSSRACPSP